MEENTALKSYLLLALTSLTSIRHPSTAPTIRSLVSALDELRPHHPNIAAVRRRALEVADELEA